MTEITERVIEACKLIKESLEALNEDAILNGDRSGIVVHKANLELGFREIRDWSRTVLKVEFPEYEYDDILFCPRMRLGTEWKPGSDPFNIAPW